MDTMESVIAYAGSNPIIAVSYPEEEKYGLISDPIVLCRKFQMTGILLLDKYNLITLKIFHQGPTNIT
ncbi:MAG: hypothetical protein WCD89_23820 [Anaerocolumna sp.]